MPSNPPTVADLEAEVATESGMMLADVGLYLRSPDATTPAIRIGLRKGAKAVGATLFNPMALQDSDVALMSSFAIERVLDHGKLHSLQWVLLNWHKQTRKHQEATSSVAVVSGWIIDERRAITARVSELKATCNEPYREPTDQVVVLRGRFDPSPPAPTPAQGAPDPNLPPCPPYPYGYGYGRYGGWPGWEGGFF